MCAILKTNKSRTQSFKNIFFIAVAEVILVGVTILSLSQYNNISQKNHYQNELRVRLNSVQIMIQSAIESNSRVSIGTIALAYERLGTTYANMSYQILHSNLDTGEWETVALILLGNDSAYSLFQGFSNSLTKEEISFLKQLSEMNMKLLSDLTDDADHQKTRNMRINTLRETLNHYHQTTLSEFISTWEPS